MTFQLIWQCTRTHTHEHAYSCVFVQYMPVDRQLQLCSAMETKWNKCNIYIYCIHNIYYYYHVHFNSSKVTAVIFLLHV